jgi:hypothetical protein
MEPIYREEDRGIKDAMKSVYRKMELFSLAKSQMKIPRESSRKG